MTSRSDRSRRILGNRRGSTLIECVASLALLGISATAISNLLTQHIRAQGTNGTTTTAIAIAAAELEDMRALDYAAMASRSSTNVVGGITYNLDSEVETDVPEANMKTIHTMVVWTEPAGVKSYSLDAIYTDVTH